MRSSVIAVSRSLAAGGEEIAAIVADRLDYRYVDDEIVTLASERAGVSPESVQAAEHTEPLVRRVLKEIGTIRRQHQLAQASVKAGVELDPAALSPSPSQRYQDLIRQVIRETADEGKVVIVARGASIGLAGVDGLLRVLVTASASVRATRLAERSEIGDREATKAIDDSDRQRKEYLRKFYGVREELPTHYDLVLNTDALTPEQSAGLVVGAAGG